MLTMVISVKTLTKCVAVARLDNRRRTKASQGTWKCGLTSEFIDVDQMSVQELMALKRTPHTTLDGNHHKWSINMVGIVHREYTFLEKTRDERDSR